MSGGTSPIDHERDRSRPNLDTLEGPNHNDDNSLKDHADTIVLELEPTLRTYCLISILSKEKPLEGVDRKKIPETLLAEIRYLNEPNNITERQTGWKRKKTGKWWIYGGYVLLR